MNSIYADGSGKEKKLLVVNNIHLIDYAFDKEILSELYMNL